MMRNVLRGVLAVSVVLGLVGVGTAANAAPGTESAALTPASGSVAGGTEVTIDSPPGVTFTQVSAGEWHSVALATDGTAYAWGYNSEMQLGDGTTTDSSVPVRVQMPAGVTFTQVSAGGRHSVALAADGTAYAWGNNFYGMLGDGTTTTRSVPVPVQMPAGVTFTQVSAGGDHSVARAADGSVYAWGLNTFGQLGDGIPGDSTVPVRVEMPAGVTFAQVSAGGYHSVARAADGGVYAWGYNASGQLGDGTITNRRVPVPVQMPAGVTVTQVSAGSWHSVALAADGAAYAWGNNGSGQLGDGTITNRRVPVQLPDGVTFAQVSAGGSHSVARAADGSAYAWGHSTTAASSVPAPVEMPAGVTFAQVSAGGSHSVALGTNHTAYAWGYNGTGQLGDGTTADKRVPARVLTLTAVTGVSFGGVSSADLVDNGDGTWTATTPSHVAGSVDVVVSWELDGVAQPDITYADAFTYVVPDVAPTVTDPLDQSVTAGDTATFTVDTTGTPEPGLLWEFSTDDGATWEAVSAADGTVSDDEKTLTVAATEALSGTLYRVTAENTIDAVTSTAARLTVSAAPVAPTVTDPLDQSVTAGDTATFTVETTGTPEPGLLWEFSTDVGHTWSVVTASDGTVSDDGKILTVAATEALSGTLYRVTAENTVDAVISTAARLTVSAAPQAPTSTDLAGETGLARTGSDVALSTAAAVVIVLIGTGLVLASRRKQA